MSEAVIPLADAQATEAAGHRLAEALRAGDVVTLEGGLGAGKTSFARGMLRGLGFSGEAPSPTFAILQGYEPPETRLPIAHVDLYRIHESDEIDELGLDDWLEGGALAIEWPDRLGGRFGRFALAIRIDAVDDGSRLLTARLPKSWEGRWPL